MTTNYKAKRSLKSRVRYHNSERAKLYYKYIATNNHLNVVIRSSGIHSLLKLQGHSQFKNSCVYTGRSHSTIRNLKISRIMLKTLVRTGCIPGIQRSSW